MFSTAKARTLGLLGIGLVLGYMLAFIPERAVRPTKASDRPAAIVANARSVEPGLDAPPDRQPPARFAAFAEPAPRIDKPNIVFILTDNLGYGELGCYGGGILRGAPTPRIDKLATEGTRLLNFNVEAQCTPSRSAIMTGRFPIRSGTTTVPRGRLYGLTQWERTIAEVLSDRGYATALFGKWHLGETQGRYPNDQGFDEWYGIPNSTSESPWTTDVGFDPKIAHMPYILEGRKGEKTHEVEVYDLKSRRLIDTEITRRTIDFMTRQTKAAKPFYAYVPFTLVHYPTLPHPDFDGKTGNGPFADSLAEMDHHVGQIIDAISGLGIADNTILIFTSDNGPEDLLPWRGWAGPWSGSYFTAMEGSLRTPFIIRWPGKVPAGRISNEIVHAVDTFTTLLKWAGAEIPKDRIIDGVDQTAFFLGQQEKSNREGFACYVGDTMYAVKWRNWKLHYYKQEYFFDPPQKLPNPYLCNLIVDPRERDNIMMMNNWAYFPMAKIVDELQASFKIEPPIAPGTPDPYEPHH